MCEEMGSTEFVPPRGSVVLFVRWILDRRDRISIREPKQEKTSLKEMVGPHKYVRGENARQCGEIRCMQTPDADIHKI